MKRTVFTFALALVPAAMLPAQQATASSQSTVSAGASAQAKTPGSQTKVNGSAQTSTSTAATADVPSNYSAESRGRLDATFSAARQRNLPEQPIRDRMAEGRAKGASEGQVVLAAEHMETRLEATQSAMIRAGRKSPSPAEVAAGEQAMARGATEAQVATIIHHTPSNRSLAVSLGALVDLTAQGRSPSVAVSQIVGRLDAQASDQAIAGLAASGSATAASNASVPRAGTAAAGSVTGSATAGATSGAAGVGAAASGVVGGVIKPPMA